LVLKKKEKDTRPPRPGIELRGKYDGALAEKVALTVNHSTDLKGDTEGENTREGIVKGENCRSVRKLLGKVEGEGAR